MPKSPSEPPHEESGMERVLGVIALFFYSLLLVELLGITLIVGLNDIAPRSAAVLMLLPALVVWVAASTQRRCRSTALMFFPPYA